MALYALMADDCTPAGIITMATPCLTCELRNLKLSGSFFRFTSFVYSLGIVLFVGVLLLFPLLAADDKLFCGGLAQRAGVADNRLCLLHCRRLRVLDLSEFPETDGRR